MPDRLIVPYTTEPCEPTPAFPEQTSISRPVVQTWLEYAGKRLDFNFSSIIDSGADTCMFPAIIGEAVGIPVRNGRPAATQGIGSDTAFYHSVKVWVEIEGQMWAFDCWAGFMYSLDMLGKGLLGRHGFFGLFHSVTFVENFVELIPKVAPAKEAEQKENGETHQG